MKLVINKCFGGFGLSDLAYEKLIEYGIPLKDYIKQKVNPKTGLYDLNENGDEKCIYRQPIKDRWHNEKYWDSWTRDYENRNNELLVKVVEELGDKANGWAAKLEVVEIPDDIKWEIDNYDGVETIHEQHRSW